MNKLDLGVLYKDGKVVNHRSLVKVLFNPILRYFGCQIATILNNDGSIGKSVISKCERTSKIEYSLKHNECDKIVKKRIIL